MIPAQRHRQPTTDTPDDWRDNLQRDADNAAKLIDEWTTADIVAFPQFMAKFSPHAIRAFHDQLPSELRRRADEYTARVRAANVHNAQERRCPRCQRAAGLKAVANGWMCRWSDCGYTSLREAVNRP